MLPVGARKFLLGLPDLLFIVTGVVVIILSHLGLLPKGHTSILCDDPDIRRILTTETVSVAALLLMATAGPFVNIFFLEWALPGKSGRSARHASSLSWRLLKDCFSGQLLALLIVEFFKMTVSEARPHFMQTCRPDLSDQLCSMGYVEVTWRNCTNPLGLDKPHLLDSMKSFPSGHAALGAFIATYMTWYLMTRLRVQWSQLLGVVLALLWGAWGALCGVSRIWDNKHHWWDVAIGAALGTCIAALTIKWLSSKHLAESRRQSTHPTTSSSLPPA
ncbi:phospholipid phosphatase 1 isoform X2 [Hyalella azteca]|uniref:Phospholipid phosphatase 1 isoform X2 n=1 Tax=Hyalella azteca TaxID=294128 RepID=A0A8B7PBF7_HYAAZ|nr:phospholipid phosphatase 1 isoform X2 [Hyalella azteca]